MSSESALFKMLMNINNSKLAADTGKTNNDTNDVFGMDLFYNTYDSNLTTQVYWDGKLALAKWMAMNASTARGFEQAFVYSYDGVNRYTGETYSERATTGAGTFTVTHGWDENSIKYDANGNIKALRRDSAMQSVGGATLIDQLKYTYSSSIPDQLYTVYDSSGSAKGFIGGATGSHYTYDANGNLTNEPYQGITGITYLGINYGTDANGNLLNVYNGTNTDTKYTWDQLNDDADNTLNSFIFQYSSPALIACSITSVGSTASQSVSSSSASISTTTNSDLEMNESPLGAPKVNYGQTVSMGVYGILNILTYGQYYNYNTGRMGLNIRIGVNNTTGFKTLRWLQVVTTNYVLRDDLVSPYFDRSENSTLPFYPLQPSQYGYDLEMHDQPKREKYGLNGGDDIFWRAVLTLGGVNGNSFFPIININYGFTIQDGLYQLIPMSFSWPLPVNQIFNPLLPENGP